MKNRSIITISLYFFQNQQLPVSNNNDRSTGRCSHNESIMRFVYKPAYVFLNIIFFIFYII